MRFHYLAVKHATCKLILFIAFMAFSAIGNIAKADLIPGTSANDFYLNFEKTELSPLTKGTNSDFENNLFYVNFNNDPSSVWNSPVNVALHWSISNQSSLDNNKDMGFHDTLKDKQRFAITGYSDNKPRYIESVEIKWADKEPCGGSLALYGRKSTPYENKDDYSYYSDNYDLKIVMSPSTENEGVVVYRLTKPVSYIAIVKELDQELPLARLEYFKVHFVSEPPETVDTDINLSILGGEEDYIQDVAWSNTGMSLSDFFYFADADGNPLADNSREGDLRFYLTPLFQPAPKPDASGLKPESMTDHQWLLYQQLERFSSDHPYDGFLSSADRLECGYIPTKHLLDISVPCAGRYKLTVEAEGANVTHNDVTLNIWSSIENTYEWLATELQEDETGYGSDWHGFSLNWVRNTDSGSGIFSYPFENQNDPTSGAFSKDAIGIFIPGLYDARIYYKLKIDNSDEMESLSEYSENSDPYSLDDYELYSEDNKPSFATLTASATAKLEIKVEKNNAVTPSMANGVSENNYLIKLAPMETPTAVAALGVESENECPAVYNLNGIRVNPSRLSPGIYIRISGRGKPEKFIVR